MTATRVMAAKELRALLPAWGAAIAVIAIAGLRGPGPRYEPLLAPAALLAYTIGAAALGALAAGQDYLFGTLASAFSLPVSRQRVLVTKMLVLVPLAVSLAGAFLWAAARMRAPFEFNTTGFTLAVLLCALTLAPWLTIVTRNLLAGALFPLAIVSLALIGAGLVTTYGYGLAPGPQADALRTTLFNRALAVAFAAGAVLSWRAFMRLEAIDGPVASIDLGAWRSRDDAAAEPVALRSRPANTARRVWLLVVKELHIQQLSFALAAMFVIAWAAVAFFYKRPALLRDFPGVLAPMYFGALALLVGALASAEERQMGMAQVQALLPVRGRLQWLVKASVTLVVALVLSLGIPLVLFYGGPMPDREIAGALVCGLAVVTAFGMYVSSLSTSGVRAMAYAVPAGIAAMWYIQWASGVIVRLARAWLPPVSPYGDGYYGALVRFLGIAAILLALAYRNDRTMERNPRRTAMQVAVVAVSLFVWLGVFALL